MKFRNFLALPVVLMTTMMITACEEDSDTAVAAAQQCLNEMNDSMSSSELSTKAAECRSILGTPTTEDGFIIECSSYFLEEGFFGAQILEAFDRVDDAGNSNNDVTNITSTFAFSSTSNASAAQEACSQSGITIYAAFGDIAQMATTIGNAFSGGLEALLSGGTPSVEDFEAALANIDTTEEFEALGTSVVSLATTICSGNSSDITEDVCPTLDTITNATSNNAEIGQCMQECMSSDSGSGTVCSINSSITCP